MNIEAARTFDQYILPTAMELFSPIFTSREARAMLLAIGLQESDFTHRRQLIGHHRHWWESLKGPASSYFQFEITGVAGVLEHHTTGPMLREVLRMMNYPADARVVHQAMVHNDLLAAVVARLALWRLPRPLPGKNYPNEGWSQYVQIWAPGKPKRERWNERFKIAWEIVNDNSF